MCDNSKETIDPRLAMGGRAEQANRPPKSLFDEAKLYQEATDKPFYGGLGRQPSIMEILEKRMGHHQQEASKFERMNELYNLLRDKPELIRILTLWEEFKHF